MNVRFTRAERRLQRRLQNATNWVFAGLATNLFDAHPAINVPVWVVAVLKLAGAVWAISNHHPRRASDDRVSDRAPNVASGSFAGIDPTA